jgi:phosphatidate cytidylyltransferase
MLAGRGGQGKAAQETGTDKGCYAPRRLLLLGFPPMTAVWTWNLGLIAIATALYAGARWFLKSLPDSDYAVPLRHVRAWAGLVVFFLLALGLGRSVTLVFFAALSYLILKELISVLPLRHADRRPILWTYLAIPAQYLIVAFDWFSAFVVFVPIVLWLVIAVRMALSAENRGFIRSLAVIQWASLVAIFGLSHLGYLLNLPAQTPLSGARLVLFVVLIAATQNILESFASGRDRHFVNLSVAPEKKWGGLLASLLGTLLVAAWLGPVLTPLDRLPAMAVAALMTLASFFGGLLLIAIGRDLQAETRVAMRPSHIDFLDCVHRLYFSAPFFFYAVRQLSTGA